MSDRKISDMKTDAEQAFQTARKYHAQLKEIYDYCMPFRASVQEQAGDAGHGQEGARKGDLIFDATGMEAAFNFAGRLQSDWMPLNQPFFKIEAGPLVPEGDARKQIDEALGAVTRVVEAVLHARTPATVHEMCFDLFAGTGAMLMQPGDDIDLIRTTTVPVNELALVDGPYGDPWHVYWRRRWKLRDLRTMWPDGEFSARLLRAIKDEPRADTTVTQYTRYDAKDRAWHLEVWCDKDETEGRMWRETFRVSPWILPRFVKVPGESYGRGLGHLILPYVKTANKTRELALTAAAFAVMGIFAYRHDGVFNVDNAPFAPLSFWPVMSNGGALGPSISRLPIPQDFDVTSIVMKDEREQIRRVSLDDEMPDEQDAVRSATEVAGRMKRYARRWGGVNTRLGIEWIVPMVRRAVDILETRGILKGQRLTIDQLTTKTSITAPALAAARADKLEAAVNYVQIIAMLFGPQAAMLATRVKDLLPEMGRWAGLDERFLLSQQEGAQLVEMIQQSFAAQAQPKEAPPPKPAEMRQGYVNGGAM